MMMMIDDNDHNNERGSDSSSSSSSSSNNNNNNNNLLSILRHTAKIVRAIFLLHWVFLLFFCFALGSFSALSYRCNCSFRLKRISVDLFVGGWRGEGAAVPLVALPRRLQWAQVSASWISRRRTADGGSVVQQGSRRHLLAGLHLTYLFENTVGRPWLTDSYPLLSVELLWF